LSEPALHLVPGTTLDDAGATCCSIWTYFWRPPVSSGGRIWMAGAAPIKALFGRTSGGLQRRDGSRIWMAWRGNDVKLHLDVLLAASGLQQRGGRIWMAGAKAPFRRPPAARRENMDGWLARRQLKLHLDVLLVASGLQRRRQNMDGRRGDDSGTSH
jgi:hypothetical protein